MKKITLLFLCFILFPLNSIFSQQPDLVVTPNDFTVLTKSAGEIYHAQSLVYNNGNAPANSSVLKYYLSTNATFDGADVFLGVDYTRTILPGASDEDGAYLVIPTVTSSGTYYILYFADAGNTVSESNESNNVTAVQVEIMSPPDLIAYNLSITTNSINAGQSKNLSYKIKNIGLNSSAGPNNTAFYLSTNNSFDSGDVVIGYYYTPIYLGTNQTVSFGLPLTIPSNTKEGNYFILAKADVNNNVRESNENNNITSTPSSFHVVASNTAKPDLTADPYTITINSECGLCKSSLSLLGSSRHIISKEAGILTINVIINNIGTATANASRINYYLSTNSTIDLTDYKFPNSTAVSSLQQGSSKIFSQAIFGADFDFNQAFGNYNIIMKIDGDDTVTESNENNNIFIIPITYRLNFFSNKSGLLLKKLINKNVQTQKPYNLNIYNLKGKLIKTVLVKNIKNENVILNGLPEALYILKSVNGSRKVLVKK